MAKDVCEILEMSDVSMATQRLDADEKLAQAMLVSGQNRSMTLISESGLYSLVMTSRKAEAKAFKKWVTSEVLPAIRTPRPLRNDPQRGTAKYLLGKFRKFFSSLSLANDCKNWYTMGYTKQELGR